MYRWYLTVHTDDGLQRRSAEAEPFKIVIVTFVPISRFFSNRTAH